MIARTIIVGVGHWLISNAMGRALIAVTAVLTGLWAFGAHQQHVGAKKLASNINSQAEKQVNEAIQARAGAQRPGAYERLRKGSCYDCD
ncbi:hypothetical protein APY04_0843 [Hyphomicrobium sulfonivorans]|uniref:Uncharacterized protein n=1 Tax=Hyphomicrobium sulfonivorans TaxID=121290 RepID=A0A120CXD4_HYPSL|nr:hypothetical protein [Hyphomicrobium sulfonivorans]KWT70782.1 hypothetical protein APY04_0843 [Hyphomicrobium sulfonivorans]